MTDALYTGFSRALDAIPVVPSSAARNARYPAPPEGFRVWNDETDAIEKYESGAWVVRAALAVTPGQVPGLGWVNVKNPTYGAKGDGTTDDTAAIQAAMTAAAGKTLFFPPGTYKVTSTLTVTNAIGQIKVIGSGGQGTTTIIKYHTGDLLVVEAGQVELHLVNLEAATATDTTYGTMGRAIYVHNNVSTTPNFKFLGGAINNIDLGIEFAADSGSGAMVANVRIAPFTTGSKSIWINGPDTAARNRHFINLSLPGGYIDVDGALDTFIVNSFFQRVEIDSAAFGTHVGHCRWGNGGNAMTISGATTVIYGAAVSGAVTLDSNFTGVFHGVSSGGTYTVTDNSGGNATILFRVPSASSPAPFTHNGGIRLTAVGTGLSLKEGTNATMGSAALVGGAVTVATTKVTATSRIYVTSQVDGGTPGWLRVSARNVGQDFTVTSSSGTDTSTIAWLLVEPSA